MKPIVIIATLFACVSGFAQTPPPLPTSEEATKIQSEPQQVLLEKNPLAALAEDKVVPNSKRERVDELNTLWFTAPMNQSSSTCSPTRNIRLWLTGSRCLEEYRSFIVTLMATPRDR